MQTDGWVKVHRKMLENPIVCKDKDYFSVWMYLLLNATHESSQVMFGGEKITLLPGQLLTTQNEIAERFKIDPSKVKRILNCFKNDKQIDKRTDMQKTLISIENWGVYQGENDKRNDKQMTNECQTNQEKGKEKNKKGFPPYPLSKKQKKKSPKEIYKNARSVCSAGAHTHEDTHTDLCTVGKYENVTVPSAWLSDFKAKYTYADAVIESLSRYKESKRLINENDIPYLEQFAESDKEKYGNRFSRKNSAMWKDESKTDEYWDNFFQIALKRSEEEMMGRKNN